VLYLYIGYGCRQSWKALLGGGCAASLNPTGKAFLFGGDYE